MEKKKKYSLKRKLLTGAGMIVLLIIILSAGFTILTHALKKDDLSGIKGVNLGSWLVLEKWMTPEVFEGTDASDEYTLARVLSEEEYEARISLHRSTFITEEDFAFLAEQGINLVRIPVPYYIFGDRADEPYIACIDYLDKAFDWAEKYGIQILIDMHMVPGSQNGFDNGGTSGVCVWAQHPEDVEYVLDVLERLAVRYADRPGLLGIQPLNEPLVSDQKWEDMDVTDRYAPADEELAAQSAPISMDFLRAYYKEAYDRLRPILREDQWIIYHDAFQMWSWLDFMNDEDYYGVAFDTHVYLFNVESVGLKGPFWHKAFVWGNGILMQALQTRFPVICGEWSLFCYYSYDVDDPEELSGYYRRSARFQIQTWEKKGAGSVFWNYRLGDGQTGENMEAWDFRKCVENGWLPAE